MIVHIHVLFDGSIAYTAFLVNFHHIGIDVEIFFGGKSADCFHFGERLKSEFTCKARQSVSHGFERHPSVPQSPVVHIARAESFFIAPVGVVGRSVNIAPGAVVFFNKFGYQLVECFSVSLAPFFIDFSGILLVPSPVVETFVYFVVTAPESQ